MKLLRSKLVTSVLIVFTILFTSGVWQIPLANAASITGVSDTMTREKAATLSAHVIKFRSTTALAAGGTIAINFSTFTDSVVFGDVNICHGATTGLEHGTSSSAGFCTAAGETMAATNGATTVWGANNSSTTLTLTAPSGSPTFPIATNDFITIFISSAHLTNPALSTPTITITNSNGDSGSFTVPIIDDDTVNVTATVNQTVSFDLNVCASGTICSNGTPYNVPLGTLASGSVTGSNESSINSIWMTLGTNASGGINVSVISSNGSLKSTGTPADTIPSATATMTAGTANYGVCVKAATTTSGTLTKASPYNGATCTATPAGNTVGALTTTAQNIITSTAPINAGQVEVMVDAAINTSTPAHSDYTDAETYIATATF